MEVITFSKNELERVVAGVLKNYVFQMPGDGARIVALHGDLGAGKTTFVQEVARQLGVTEAVTSPTFVIMKTYETEHDRIEKLIHIDAYRLESLDETRPLQFAEVLALPNTLVCIEWAARIEELLPETTINVNLSIIDQATRKMVIYLNNGLA